MHRLRYRYMALLIAVCLLALWVGIWRFHQIRSQDALALYNELQREYVDQTARSMKQWLTLRMEKDGVDEATARQEAIEKFIKPMILVPGSGAWVCDEDMLLFQKGPAFSLGREGVHLESLLTRQETNGGYNCRKLSQDIRRFRRGSEWYAPNPEHGPLHASWTTVSAGEADFIIGLSTPASEVLSQAGIPEGFVREVGAGTIITALALLVALFLWRQNQQGRKLIAVMEDNAAYMGNTNRRLEDELAEREAMEASLRASEAQKNAIIDGVPSALMRLDSELRIQLANRAAARAAGMEQQALVGKVCYKVFAGAEQPCENCPAIRALEKGSTQSAEVKMGDGALYKVRAFPAGAGTEAAEGVIVIARDVTEKQRLEAQLRQSQKMEAIGTLAGGIAHDFNNVLTIIRGNLELAEEDVPQQNPARLCLSEALKACARARDLVRQILSFSRRNETQPLLIRLHEAVADSLHLLRHTIPSTIDVKLADSVARDTVMADPTQVSQILLNLTSNAAHAMRDTGGSIRIRLDNGEEDPLAPPLREDTPWGWVRMVFSDSGPGIPSHLIKRVFDPYFTTKAVGEGTGMGLSVVHGIVASYKGHIRITSEPGQGTSFFVYLPLVMGDPGEEARERTGKLPGGTERILLVDDEAPVAVMANEVLVRLGYQVTAHTRSLAALADFALSPESYDLIITDQTMPHLTGLGLARKIHEIKKDVPVLLLTGFSESVNDDTTLVAGVSKVLLKPVGKAALAEAIREVLAPIRAAK